jgi:hypothetical protein
VKKNLKDLYETSKWINIHIMGSPRRKGEARCQWLIPVILATLEAEIRRIMVQSQLKANSS